MAGKKTSSGKRHSASIQNRKARYNYSITEEIEAGIVLTGTEVKSLRAGQASINDAHAGEMQGELWLFNSLINEYAGGNRQNHEPRRARKLLVHAKQRAKLLGQIKTKGMALVPLSLYFNGRGFAKVKLGLGLGKKEYEKRETIKKRDWEKEKRRIMKNK